MLQQILYAINEIQNAVRIQRLEPNADELRKHILLLYELDWTAELHNILESLVAE